MRFKKLIILFVIFFSTRAVAQWQVDAGVGVTFPVTGYGKVVKTGFLIFNADGQYRFKSGLGVGMKIQMARFAKDNNPADSFFDAKITVAPVLLTAEFTFNRSKNFQPYVTGGLGLSFFAVSYNSSPTAIDDKQISNVSFTMMPLVGFRYKVNEHLYAFLELGFVILADGPPIGFPMGEKATGYNFISAGLQYKF
jgi:opacity protein-like surface antigen